MLLKDRHWRNLLEAIDNQSCILLLGPSISTSAENIALLELFAQSLTEELEEEQVAYDTKYTYDLTYIMQRYTTIRSVTPNDPGFEAKRFYQQHNEHFNEIQSKLAKLPFSLVINTAPDDLIAKAFRSEGKPKTVHQFYNFRRKNLGDSNAFAPSKDKPLIFNLFGYFKEPESLVLTEADQITLISNVVKDSPPLPPELMQEFDEFKTYLFLGFDWEKWQLRLLLNNLNLRKDSNVFSPQHKRYKVEDKTKEFYKSEFRFQFVDDNVLEFVNQLFEKYQEFKGVASSKKKIVIFNHTKDEHYRDQLSTALSSLKSIADCWHDGLIGAGEEIEQVLDEKWSTADFLIVLLSMDLLASEKIEKVIKVCKDKKAKVIPVIVRTCDWESVPELSRCFPILPNRGAEIGIPINTWENEDDACKNIVQEIKQLLQ